VLGYALLAERQPEAALAAFEAAISHGPLWGEAQLGRVEALLALGRSAAAREALEAARPVIAALPRLRQRLAQLSI
jgi:tetratricopeptide (TPR) repeat protein